MPEYHQGVYRPRNPQKYAGNATQIVYRSSWEYRVMFWLDTNANVLLWNSEGLSIPYVSPLDGKQHRYFPDMLAKIRTKTGDKTFLLEIKPHAQTQLRTPKRKTRRYLNEVATYAVNVAKWEAAQKVCEEQGWEFKILTEHDLHL